MTTDKTRLLGMSWWEPDGNTTIFSVTVLMRTSSMYVFHTGILQPLAHESANLREDRRCR